MLLALALLVHGGAIHTGTGVLILGEAWRRRPLVGWVRKAGAARCLSMLKARVDCIVCVVGERRDGELESFKAMVQGTPLQLSLSQLAR